MQEMSHGNAFLDSKTGGRPDDPQEGDAGKLEYRCDLLDPVAILVIANVMHEGCKRHETDGWRRLQVKEHVNHALTHIFLHMAGSKTEDHLGRALTRLMMAVGVERGKTPQGT